MRVDAHGRQNINRESVFGDDDFFTGINKRTDDQVQHVIRSVAQSQFFRRDPQPFGQLALKRGAGSVWIARGTRKCLVNRIYNIGANPSRIFVRGKLYDIGKTQLSLETLNRFARLIGLEVAYPVCNQSVDL